MKLKNKIALITGAGGDLGRGMAIVFAQEGAHVIVNDINVEKANETVQMVIAKGGAATSDTSDLTDTKAVNKMIDHIIKELRSLHILVNNAGDVRDAQLVNMTDEEWDFVLDLNLKASFVCARAVAPHMIDKGYGKILNFASMSYKGNIGQANYTSAKAGVVGLTQALGLELARHRINVNCIAPGLINTPKAATLDEKVRNYLIKKTPMRCMGDISDVAKTALFLVSDDAKFITRQIVHVSGGMEGF